MKFNIDQKWLLHDGVKLHSSFKKWIDGQIEARRLSVQDRKEYFLLNTETEEKESFHEIVPGDYVTESCGFREQALVSSDLVIHRDNNGILTMIRASKRARVEELTYVEKQQSYSQRRQTHLGKYKGDIDKLYKRVMNLHRDIVKYYPEDSMPSEVVGGHYRFRFPKPIKEFTGEHDKWISKELPTTSKKFVIWFQ